MMGWNSAVEVIACIFRTGINGGGPIAPGRLIPPPYPKVNRLRPSLNNR